MCDTAVYFPYVFYFIASGSNRKDFGLYVVIIIACFNSLQ